MQAWVASAFYLFILMTRTRFCAFPIRRSRAGTSSGAAGHRPSPCIRRCSYLGYVGFSISFSFAIAALIEGRIDAAWRAGCGPGR